MASGDSPLVVVTHIYPFQRETVFNAWLDPGKVGKWMFGPPLREETIVRMGLEARVGGHFSFVVNREGKDFDHVGEYLEIESPQLLAFTWGIKGMSEDPESRVRVEIVPTTGGCELSLQHQIPAEWAEFVNRTKEGWTKMLASLEKTLAREGKA
ncbi:SRPBCC domain-containing protein [Luteolibacter luteus]|uniref:SRPBCC domain-containing protein n=1 Tax=Luteolibacter luteus TaxID=2728835 RepID=A0A858RGJ1_9BACT|nr:SRPBCC domain-containing protein [Luteolibacter luteus]